MKNIRVYKSWYLYAHRMPMFRWHLGISLELIPGDNYCLSVHLAWLGNFYLQLDNADSRCCETYQ